MSGRIRRIIEKIMTDQIRKSTVLIVDKNKEVKGTGFFLKHHNNIYCITCYHVIENLKSICIKQDVYATNIYDAELLKDISDSNKDIAVLSVKGLINNDFLVAGGDIYVDLKVKLYGYFSDTTNMDWLYGETKDAVEINGNKYYKLKVDSKIAEGSSGSAVVTEKDLKVVGMLTAKRQKDEYVGYIIPIYVITNLLNKPHVNPPQQTDIASFLSEGNKYYYEGKYDEAIKCYDKIINDPNYVGAWNNKGLALYELKKYDEAIQCYDKALSIDPNYVDAWNNKGLVLYELKRYDDAIQCYDKALSIDPNYVGAWNNKGNALYELKRYDEAIQCYDKALSIDPNNAYAWYNKGNVLYELKRYNDAIQCYDKALSIDPNYVKAWNNKGLVLHKLKRYDEAIQCYDKALSIDPNNAYAWYNKGNALHELKRYNDAIQCYDKALSIDPNYVNAWYNKGLVLYELKRYDDAIQCYTEAYLLNKDIPTYLIRELAERYGITNKPIDELLIYTAYKIDKNLARTIYTKLLKINPTLKRLKDELNL